MVAELDILLIELWSLNYEEPSKSVREAELNMIYLNGKKKKQEFNDSIMLIFILVKFSLNTFSVVSERLKIEW